MSADALLRAELLARIRAGDARAVLQQVRELAGAAEPELLHVQALALAHCGVVQQAIDCWETLLSRGYWSEELVLEMARACLALGEASRAAPVLAEWAAQAAHPGPELVLEWARILLAEWKSDSAARAAALLEEHLPTPVETRDALLLCARIQQAQWPAVEADAPQALGEYAERLLRYGYPREAVALLEHRLERCGPTPAHVVALARARFDAGDTDAAMNDLAAALEREPEDGELLLAAARLCLDDQAHRLAGATVARAEVALGADDTRVRGLAGEVLLGLGELQAVATLLAGSDDPALDPLRVAYYSRVNRAAEAMHYQDRLVAASGRSIATLQARARLAESVGDAEQVVALAEEILDRHPRSLAARGLLIAHRGGQVELEHLHRVREALHRGALPRQQRAWLAHCLADHHHRLGDFDLAGELYDRCNRLSEPEEGERYAPEEHASRVDELIRVFSTAPDTAGDTDARLPVPVFIVGVPRSGTTLTEQLLGRHPSALAMGECQHLSLTLQWLQEGGGPQRSLAEAFERCDEGRRRELRHAFYELLHQHLDEASGDRTRRYCIDKMPDNYLLLGWLRYLLPEAKIIYARRDPREIALSCWRANFGAIRWAYRVEDIAGRIVEHHRIMDHWLTLFRGQVFVSDYAALVQDPERQVRRLLSFIGLPWHPDCLDQTRGEAVVRTASVNQVRQPVYRSSLAAWRHYRQPLAAAVDLFALRGLVDRDGE
jgi:tetratricopeptide (TPR) repeat protein